MYYYVLLSVTQKKIHRKLLCIFCATFVQYRMLHRLITLCVKHPMFDILSLASILNGGKASVGTSLGCRAPK